MKSYTRGYFYIFSIIFINSCASEAGVDDFFVEQYGKDVIRCSIESQNKTSLQNLLPVWTDGDAISVFGSNGAHARFTLSAGQGTAIGSFAGSLPASSEYSTIYPYSDNNAFSDNLLSFTKAQEQEGVADDMPVNGNTMVATFEVDNPAPAFKNLFGLLEVRLSGTAEVAKITLTSNSNEMLWGNFTLTMDDNIGTDQQTLNVSGGSNETSLVFNSPYKLSSDSAHSFYFVLPHGSLSSGFTIDVLDENDNYLRTQPTTKNQQISRAGIRTMVALENVNKIDGDDVIPQPFTWVAYNNLGRTGTSDQTVIDPQTSGYPQKKQDKYVGAFYFIWHTANSSGGGPYDVQKALGNNYHFVDVADYQCGGGKTHHWGEPYLGYYKDDDLWVLRKHVQMLADAGVDFIAFDVTNNKFYISEITKLCDLYLQMRAEGYKTPQLTFMVWHSGANNTAPGTRDQFNHNEAVTTLYNNFYAKQAYNDLWFRWDGKPLMMAIGSDVTNTTIKNYFTFRQTWFLWNQQAQTSTDVNDPWYYQYEGPNGKWPWGVCYIDNTNNPMRAGVYNGVNEFCSVAPATHPVSNIGRSYPINSGIVYNSGEDKYPLGGSAKPEKGIYFKSQFNAAYALDPQIMFFTGWNEFLMGHFTPGTLEFNYCGGKRVYNSLFIDQYNHEFSRDIEPIAGGFGDNYYYYMADFIRKFKGVDTLPVYSQRHTITIDGKFADWINVNSSYADDLYDIKWRGYDSNGGNDGWPAYGNTLPNYVNKTGRNDLKLSKVTTDGTNVSFYIEAVENLTGYSNGNTGLNLLISSGSGSSWEGFNYLLEPTSDTKATLKASAGNSYQWTDVTNNISICVVGRKMEVCIPLSLIGINNANSFTLDFKWVDNVDLSQSDGIQRCMRDGDSAPNGRFRYRYVFQYAN